MAAGGGGSWKVAYADFVTAMMAFFLVMWICAQDQNVREAVAHYFNEPFQFYKDPVGASKKPEKSGSIFAKKTAGRVPESEKVALGMGTRTFTSESPASVATKMVSEWVMSNEKVSKYWQTRAAQANQTAARAKDNQGDPGRIEENAVQILAQQMQTELKGNGPAKRGDNIYEDLLGDLMAEVNWTQVAGDLLSHERLPQPMPAPAPTPPLQQTFPGW